MNVGNLSFMETKTNKIVDFSVNLFPHTSSNLTSNLPIAIFHGISDQCDGWIDESANYVGNTVGSYSRCIESGANSFSVFQSIIKQAEKACEIINSDLHYFGIFSRWTYNKIYFGIL
jgi:hypothetical protein